MATLISPGVSVSVINESFFFPVSATTVPLIFLATRAGKTQTDGVTAAAGTLEHGVVRTVTSQSQSLSSSAFHISRMIFQEMNSTAMLAMNTVCSL